jgi:hypothetical protein
LIDSPHYLPPSDEASNSSEGPQDDSIPASQTSPPRQSSPENLPRNLSSEPPSPFAFPFTMDSHNNRDAWQRVPIAQLKSVSARIDWVQDALKDLEKDWGRIGSWACRFEDEWLEHKDQPRETADMWLDSLGTLLYEGRSLISNLGIALEGELPASVTEGHALLRQAFKLHSLLSEGVIHLERNVHHCYGR